VTRRLIVVVLATATLALLLAIAAPRAEAVSFVDKQVQAGALLIQNYINTYGQAHQFVYPPRTMVEKGGGLPNATLIWPSNPWTGKIMGPGSSRGTYTYTLGADGRSYKLTVHLSSGKFVLKSGIPSWLKDERNTAARQNLLLLQRYVESYAGAHGAYPAPAELVAGFAGYSWPKNPWTGADMIQADTLGEFRYTGGGATYSLKVMLTSGWSGPALGPLAISRLVTAPAD
jgi:type II secretory pathway pseudopilin PulG